MQRTGRLTRVADLSEKECDEMFTLMDRYYADIDRTTFDADLTEKQWGIQVVDPVTKAIRGFSTQMLIDMEIDGRSVRALFSGDTIVDHRFRFSDSLAHVWGQLVLKLTDESELDEMYWFLIAKGYKTYRFLPVFFNHFYPRFDRPTPDSIVQRIDALGRHKYPQGYDSAAGIVRAGRGSCRLREGVADFTDGRLRDPHVRFFSERNPGWLRGDELCCLAPLRSQVLATSIIFATVRCCNLFEQLIFR